MGLFDGLNLPRWNIPPGQFMLESAQAADGVGRSFAGAFNAAQDRNFEKDLIAKKEAREQEAQAKIASMAGALGNVASPEEGLQIFSKNPQWLVDPATRTAASAWLETQGQMQKIRNSTMEGLLEVKRKEDMADLQLNWGLQDPNNPDDSKAARLARAKSRFVSLANANGIADPVITSTPPLLPNGDLNQAEAERILLMNRPKLPEGFTPEKITSKNPDGTTTTFSKPPTAPAIPPGLVPSSVTVGPTGKATTTFRVPEEQKPKSNPYQSSLERAEAKLTGLRAKAKASDSTVREEHLREAESEVDFWRGKVAGFVKGKPGTRLIYDPSTGEFIDPDAN
jgi:hypothetical protein